MNDSGFSSGDAVLTAAMSGGAFGGNRGGLWGNNGGIVPEVAAFNTLSDGTATKEAIDGNREFTKVGLDRLADTVAVSSRGREFDRVNDSVADLSRDVANGKLDNVERANLNTIKILETSAASDAKLAECCCKQSLQACKDHADLKATIISESNATRALSLEIEGRANVSALAAANAKITQLETINALSQRCGCNG